MVDEIDKYGRINIIAKDYKAIVKLQHKGMWHLVSSLEFSCKWHKRYASNNLPKYYDQYKPGTLVFVDFGMNVGSEFSKPHFAIILNKSDNKRNGNVTVIPLTSKSSPHVYGINDSIFINTMSHLREKLKEIDEDVAKYSKELSETEEQIKDTAQTLNVYCEDAHITDICLEMLDLAKNYTEADVKSIVLQRVDDLLKNFGRYNAKLKEERLSKGMIIEVLDLYSKYNKKSYACYKNIETVSKLRIRKVNKFDPSGSIQVSKSTYDEIKTKTLENIF